MNQPTIEVLPLRRGVSSQSPTQLELMVRITPPEATQEVKRPLLNLALVIDRSGSMGGAKLEYAKQAAIYAVENLLPEDRVSVVAYDDLVQVIVPSTLATDKRSIIQAIRSIHTCGSTALHAGWLEGAAQVSHHLDSERLNRVILLSDGLANVGETNPDVIATDVSGLKEHGVSTTTMGLGRAFNENLMQAMAMSGEGNYYFIESPHDLPRIFDAELQGLMTTRGTNVRLFLNSSIGTTLIDNPNDLKADKEGRLILPNLVSGMPVLLGGTLLVPAKRDDQPIGELHLSWDDADSKTRESLSYTFNLPSMVDVKLQGLPTDPEVEGYLAELRATKAKEEAVRRLDRGDSAGFAEHIGIARGHMAAAPASYRKDAELFEIGQLEQAWRSNDELIARKHAHEQIYRKKQSRGFSHDYRQAGLSTRRQDQATQGLPGLHQNLQGRLEVVLGDLTHEVVDAIVNPTNTHLFGTGGTDGAVHRAGGPELTRACREIGRCEPGRAVFTDGFNLPAKYVIHTVGPRWQGGDKGEARILASCYRHSLLLAMKLGVKTISFPSIATGTYGYPIHEAASIAINEISAFLQRDQSLERVRIVCFDPDTLAAYEQALRNVLLPNYGR